MSAIAFLAESCRGKTLRWMQVAVRAVRSQSDVEDAAFRNLMAEAHWTHQTEIPYPCPAVLRSAASPEAAQACRSYLPVQVCPSVGRGCTSVLTHAAVPCCHAWAPLHVAPESPLGNLLVTCRQKRRDVVGGDVAFPADAACVAAVETWVRWLAVWYFGSEVVAVGQPTASAGSFSCRALWLEVVPAAAARPSSCSD